GRIGLRHQENAGGVEDRAGAEHAWRTVLVRDRTGERLPQAPEQILDRERQPKHITAPAVGARQRRQKETERRARPETDDRNDATESDQDRRRAPARQLGRRGHSGHWILWQCCVPVTRRWNIVIGQRPPKRKLVMASIRKAHGSLDRRARGGLAKRAA